MLERARRLEEEGRRLAGEWSAIAAQSEERELDARTHETTEQVLKPSVRVRVVARGSRPVSPRG